MTEAILGYGSVFQTWSGAEWVTVAEASAMALPPLSRDVIDAGHECAPDEWRDSIVGLKSAGEISVVLNFTASEYSKRYDHLGDGVLECRILLPDESVYPFSAYEIGLEVGVAVGEKISATAKFKVKGEPGPLVMGLPFADGEPPALYANYIDDVYWHHNSYFDNVADWMTSIGGVFTRAGSIGLVRDDSGQYADTAANVPRLDHDNSGSRLGLLIEEARTQWLANSLTCSSMGTNTILQTSSAVVAPYPPATVKKGILNGSDTAVAWQFADDVFDAAQLGQTVILSAYVWIPTDANILSVHLRQEQSAAPWTVKTPVAVADLSKRDQWQRIWGFVQADNTGTSNVFPVLRLTCTSPTGSFIYTTMWQVEIGAMPTTWIPSTAAGASRNGESFEALVSGVTGYKSDRGTILSHNQFPYDNVINDGVYRLLFGQHSNDGINSRHLIYRAPFTDGQVHTPISSGGVNWSSFQGAAGTLINQKTSKIALAFQDGVDGSAYVDGVNVVQSVASGVSANTKFNFGVGCDALSRVVAYWPKRVSNAELDRLTT